jgi:CheY-like chemotaxis protein
MASSSRNQLRNLTAEQTLTRLATLDILFVERDPHVRALGTQFLVEAGHRVDFAQDGLEALEKIQARAPDLVVSEILVPKLDGLALCRRLKTNPDTCHIFVLVLSILAARARATEAGADGFLLKPLSRHRLIAMVQELNATRSSHAAPQERA